MYKRKRVWNEHLISLYQDQYHKSTQLCGNSSLTWTRVLTSKTFNSALTLFTWVTATFASLRCRTGVDSAMWSWWRKTQWEQSRWRRMRTGLPWRWAAEATPQHRWAASSLKEKRWIIEAKISTHWFCVHFFLHRRLLKNDSKHCTTLLVPRPHLRGSSAPSALKARRQESSDFLRKPLCALASP